jgi:hypothetical protein
MPAGSPGQLTHKLHSRLRQWLLPFAAVFGADLAALARSWMLRVWLMLTALIALVAILDHASPHYTTAAQPGTVLAAVLHPIDTTSGAAHTLGELLKCYVVVWLTFVIVLCGGAISSELGVVADSVLSRGISRWQYFLGKWLSRLAAMLGVFLVVMAPTTLFLWMDGAPRDAAVIQTGVGATTRALHELPDPLPDAASLSLPGLCFAIGRVAAILTLAVTCSVASSAVFGSTVLSIAVAWVSLYGTGLALWLLNIRFLSPSRLVHDLPAVSAGHFAAPIQWWTLAVWLTLAGLIAIASGSLFARRDL